MASSAVAAEGLKAWTTLLTKRNGYVAGLLVLDHTIKKHKSAYPLVVMLSGEAASDRKLLDTLEAAGIPVRIVEKLEPAPQNGVVNRGTWEKLAPWSFTEYERMVLLDSDQIARQNFDELMTMEMPPNTIAASHACTCNPRKLAHYPKDWVPENCGFTAADKTTGQPRPLDSSSPKNHHLLNSGTVVLQPSQAQYDALIHTMNTHPAVPSMIFYDQDLLPIVYEDRWIPLPYIYNGLKTLRGCHADLWKDNAVKILHYILQKPWTTRTVEDDVVGMQHKFWWDEYEDLERKWYGQKNRTRSALWETVVVPHVAPRTTPIQSFAAAAAAALPWQQASMLANRQLPPVPEIPEAYRSSGNVLVGLFVALFLGFFLGRGTKSSQSRKGESLHQLRNLPTR